MKTSLRKGTVCFLRNKGNLLLAYIEYSPLDKKWTGIGGFAEEGETLEEAVVREAKEETFIELDKNNLVKVVELNGAFQLNVFLTYLWSGEIKVKEPSLKELKWFPIEDLPYEKMHPGTKEWLEPVLEGKKLRIADGKVEEVSKFN